MAKILQLIGLAIVALLGAYFGISPNGQNGQNGQSTAEQAQRTVEDVRQTIEQATRQAAPPPLPSTRSNTPAPASVSTNSVGARLGAAAPLEKGWSRTKPNINLTHVFFGEINRRGEATGFHARPGGIDPDGARLKRVVNGPNKSGVYTARIEIYDRDERQWKEKFSSFFPDGMDQQQVMDAILNAFNKRDKRRDAPWEGPSGYGFRIQGYESSRSGINTAFPVFERD